MRFSQRIGKRPVKTALQVESMDEDLKNGLWNVVLEEFFEKLDDDNKYETGETEKEEVCKIIWKQFYKEPIDKIPTYNSVRKIDFFSFLEYTRNRFYESQWYDVYDFIEFISELEQFIPEISLIKECNRVLKQEVSGYRIINGQVTQITSEEEIQSIETALSETNNLKSVNEHLQTALDMLADRKAPDYRNSIKESISAVEALCNIITGSSSSTLGKALTELEKKHALHGSLKGAFSALYGWTSDAGGIRHALEENNAGVDFEDAKFMLVSCSAFVNYLKAKMKI